MIKRKRLRYTLIAAVSIDGKITHGNREGSEWTSREDKQFFKQELDRAHVVAMGRRTFESIRRLCPRNRIVFTRRPGLVRPSGHEGKKHLAFTGTDRELEKLLTTHNWSRIVIAGGTEIYDWFLVRGLVDQMYITVEPRVFGTGKPLCTVPFLKRLSLTRITTLNARGTVLLRYENDRSKL